MNVISRHSFTRPRSSASSRVARNGAVAALPGAIVVGTAISASAHVGVLPDSTTAGHESQLTFRVPDESNTIKLVVTLPQDRPFTDVSTQPMPGWTAAVAEAPLPKPVNVGGATVTKSPPQGDLDGSAREQDLPRGVPELLPGHRCAAGCW